MAEGDPEPAVPPEVVNRWKHSFEEDEDGVEVYRPADQELPLARGRQVIEIHADGSVVRHDVGATDIPQTVEGRCVVDEDDIHIMSGADDAPDRDVVFYDENTLKLKRSSPKSTRSG